MSRTLPTSARWALLLPTAGGAAALVGGALALVGRGAWTCPPNPLPALVADALVCAPAAWAFVEVGLRLAPDHKRRVALVLSILLGLLGLLLAVGAWLDAVAVVEAARPPYDPMQPGGGSAVVPPIDPRGVGGPLGLLIGAIAGGVWAWRRSMGGAPSEPTSDGWRALARTDWGLVLAAMVLLIAYRATLLLSILPELHQVEFTNTGRLALDLAGGTFGGHTYADFMGHYGHGFHAEGTMVGSILVALLAQVIGPNGWALYGSTILPEALMVGLAVVVLLRATSRGWALLGFLLLVFVPGVLPLQQLSPAANHTEFLWMPMAMVLFLGARDPGERPVWHWLWPAFVLAFGVFCYRLNIVMVAAFAVALLWSFRPRAILLGLVGVAGAVLLMRQLGGEATGGFAYMVDGAEAASLTVGALVDWVFLTVPSASSFPCDYVRAETPLLLMALWGCFRRGPSRLAITFALGWAVAGVAAPFLMDQDLRRYHLQVHYGLLMAALLATTTIPARWRGLPALLLVSMLAMSGAQHADLQRPERWAGSAMVDSLALGQKLGVHHYRVGQEPYLRRMVEAGYFNRAVGFLPHPFEEGENLSHEYPHGSLAERAQQRADELRAAGGDVDEYFAWAGRGAWVSADMDFSKLRAWWLLHRMPEPLQLAAWRGAVAEAALWDQAPPPQIWDPIAEAFVDGGVPQKGALGRAPPVTLPPEQPADEGQVPAPDNGFLHPDSPLADPSQPVYRSGPPEADPARKLRPPE